MAGETKSKKSWWLVWAVAGMVMLPALYVLGYGPALWLHEAGWLSDAGLAYIWGPLLERMIRYETASDRALQWYAEFWVSRGQLFSLLFEGRIL